MPKPQHIEKASEVREFAVYVLEELFPEFIPDEIFLTLTKDGVVEVVAQSRYGANKQFVIYLSEGEPISARIIFEGKDTTIPNPQNPPLIDEPLE